MKAKRFWRALIIGTLLASLVILLLPGPAMACDPVYHQVRAGETLGSIAARYGVSVWAIARANGLANINYIYVGQWLRIPICRPSAPPSGSYRIHIVRPGETLSLIAARYGVSMWELARINGIRNVNRIYVGQRLAIPVPYSPPLWPPYPPYPPPPPPSPPPSCSITPILGFGRVWSSHLNVQAALGCATEPEFSTDATQQRFQQGIVLWRADENRFWVLWNDRRWGEYAADQWYSVAWRLGWPVDAGALTKVSIQHFDGGTMLWTPTLGIYVLYSNGIWQHFN